MLVVVIVSLVASTIGCMDGEGWLVPLLELRGATSMVGRVVFGGGAVRGLPVGGDLLLSAGGGSWRGVVSTSALDAADRLWGEQCSPEGLSDEKSLAIARVVVGYEARFYGLEVDWAAARFEVVDGGLAVRFSAPVRWGELLEVGVRRATVALELVDRAVMSAEFVLSDGDELEVFDREDLDRSTLEGPSIDSMAWWCLASLGECLVARGLRAPGYWRMSYSEFPAGDGVGSCGDLHVWTTFRR